MLKCPRCKTESTSPKNEIENDYFSLKYYACANCHHVFKVARVKYPTTQ